MTQHMTQLRQTACNAQQSLKLREARRDSTEIQSTHPCRWTQFSGAIISKVCKLISWSSVPVACRRTSLLVPRSADLDLESWFGCCNSCSSTAGIDKAWIVKIRSEVMQQKLSASHIASCIALNLYIIARLSPHTLDSTPVPCNLNLSVVWPCHVFFSIPYHQLSLKLRQQLFNPSQWTQLNPIEAWTYDHNSFIWRHVWLQLCRILGQACAKRGHSRASNCQ